MKLIVAGSRTIPKEKALDKLMDSAKVIAMSGFNEIVSGGCRGVDEAGEAFAEYYDLKLTIMEAEWGKWGKAAGPIRNRKMAEYADALFVIWDGKSSGSKNMIKAMEELDKEIFQEIQIEPEEV